MKFEKDILNMQKLSDSELETTAGGEIGFDSFRFKNYLDNNSDKFVISRYISAVGHGLYSGCCNNILEGYGRMLTNSPWATVSLTLVALGSTAYAGYKAVRGCVLGIKKLAAKRATKPALVK